MRDWNQIFWIAVMWLFIISYLASIVLAVMISPYFILLTLASFGGIDWVLIRKLIISLRPRL